MFRSTGFLFLTLIIMQAAAVFIKRPINNVPLIKPAIPNLAVLNSLLEVPYALPIVDSQAVSYTIVEPPCDCGFYDALNPCGCSSKSCGCATGTCLTPISTSLPVSTCNCGAPIGYASCGCGAPTPACACGSLAPGCGCALPSPLLPPLPPVIGCTKYLRQVSVQPPFL